jgi:hypothetical protein
MLIQRAEVAGPPGLRPGAHAVTIGLAFAIAFVFYVTSAHARASWSLLVVAAATIFAAWVLLRDARASRSSVLGLAGATAVVVTELAFVLLGGPASPGVCAALLVLTVYALSGVSHAVLDAATRHVYVEIGLVTLGGLIAIGVGAARV